METRGFWCLAGVSDRELQSSLGALLESGARTEARIVAHLAEVEERRLHLRAGSSSMFDYCTKRLELSENEAFHRIAASRAARQFPIVFTLLERREVHLTAICLLREHLTRENHAELLAEAAHKTKRQIQELIARRFPTPDAESRIRKLPERQARVANTGLAIAGVPVPVTAAPVLAVQEVMAPTAAIPVSPPLAEPMPSRPSPSPASAPPPVRGVIEPTSAARYRIQLNASAALKEKLDLLRALTSHSNPEGDLAAVIELAVDVALDKVQRDRFAKTERPRRSSGHRGIQTTEKSRKRARGSRLDSAGDCDSRWIAVHLCWRARTSLWRASVPTDPSRAAVGPRWRRDRGKFAPAVRLAQSATRRARLRCDACCRADCRASGTICVASRRPMISRTHDDRAACWWPQVCAAHRSSGKDRTI